MSDAKKNNWTIGEILQWTKQYFSEKGVENPRLDAEVLLSDIVKLDRLRLYVNFDQPLQQQELDRYRDYVKKRVMRLPVAYILGRKEFMGLEFAVNPAVLIPRPETELLVETVLKRLEGCQNPAILDIGTGSGAIILSVLKLLPAATGLAVDISPQALAVARDNADRLGVAERVTFRESNLLTALGEPDKPAGGFDAILSNPPYIKDEDIPVLAPEVGKEPRTALAGGRDGLDFYRLILQEAAGYLQPEGFLAWEIGAGQSEDISRLARESGWTVTDVLKDLAGIERVMVLIIGK
ncbi:peptide chain release factor N(5)-glutamine methyltransferase [Acetonema longum]|uniref:Release factor glutamine methyltransferase n=1 Tax=Acetonema longum DSM 6540 TaxID=1009370 RepID=F7NIR1_9FIRM|nr:peptide chain release factor N(5)-glutamine methyltransferase [Acetonema longum]EGO64034.1 N5-glutamine S-adenosyl-L-methionine-dependent methyltransferase [Acetonema longum DSM 6540]